ncbi:unnamed protein product, partial [Meganyctiphanes norvegica]
NSVDQATEEKFKTKTIPALLNEYAQEDVYNGDVGGFAFSCLLALAVGSPQFNNGPFANILRSESIGEGTPNFSYGFESDDGISINSRGFQGSAGQANMEGSYSFTLPDGTIAEVRWVADEQGFRAESPLLPVAPPMPAHALEQVRFAEEQRARGLVWDNAQVSWVQG